MRASLFAVAVAMLFAGPAVLAQSAAGSDGTPEGATRLAEIVVVAARRPQPAEEVAGSVSVIDRPAIERLQAQDIRDLVRYEPGVHVISDPTRFGLESFNIRGVQGNRVALRIDGVPLPDAFSVGLLANVGRDQVDPEFVQRLEILRGPASALYGSDALGGIVTLSTRVPTDVVDRGDAGGEVRLAWTERDAGWRASVLGAWQGDTHGAMLALGDLRAAEAENHPLPGDPASNPADLHRQSALAKWTSDFDAVYTSLSVERYIANVASDVRTLINGAGRFNTTERLLSADNETRERALGSAVFTAPTPWLEEIDVRAYWQGSRAVQYTDQYRRAAPPAQRFPTRVERTFRIAQWQNGVQALARSGVVGGALQQQWVYGIEALRTRVKERRDGLETNRSTGATTNVILGERLPVRDFPNSVLRSEAAFASGEFRFIDTPWSLLAGARWDRFRVDPEADALFREDFPNLVVSSTRDSQTTPKLALRWDLAPDDRLWLAWAEGFRAPPFSDVNIGLILPVGNYIVLPNPDLEPERSRGLEIGWNHDGAHAQWRVSAYDNRYRNLIETRANLGVNAQGATVFQSVNRTAARIRGFEGAARVELARYGTAWEPWSVRAAFSIARGDDTARDAPLNTVQPDRLLFAVERAGGGGWPALWVEATAVARVERVDRSNADLYAPPGYVLVDFGLRYEFGHGLSIDAALRNLGDVRYWEWAALRGVLTRNNPAPSFYTSPDRNLAVTLTWAY